MSALKIAIAGVNGRMGRVLVEAVNNHPDTVLSGALEHSGSEVLGLDAGFASGIKTGITISDDVDAILAQSDVLIDFTRPEPTLKHLQKCVEKGVNIIIGTTVMAEGTADALGRALKQGAVYGREGHTGPRNPSTIGFATVRAGDIVGDHTALFATDGERVEITHKASSRMTFAAGAVRAAVWVNGKTGLYDMQDVLGLKNS